MLKPSSLRYRILLLLLYGRHSWLTRHPTGWITIPYGPLAATLRSTKDRVADSLQALSGLGLLADCKCQRDYATAKPNPPVGMAWTSPGEVVELSKDQYIITVPRNAND